MKTSMNVTETPALMVACVWTRQEVSFVAVLSVNKLILFTYINNINNNIVMILELQADLLVSSSTALCQHVYGHARKFRLWLSFW